MKTIDVIQGSPEWFAARAGKVTASRLSDVLAQGKGGAPSATRAQYKAQLIAERLTGKPGDMFQNKWTEHGNDTEAQAAAVYEMHTGNELEPIGLVLHPTIEASAASPDRLIKGQRGLVQIKCTSHAVHLASLMGKAIEGGYQKQMQWEMACTEYEFNEFVSFNPHFPEDMQLVITRLNRDSAAIIEYTGAVKSFLAEVEADTKALVSKIRGAT